MPIELFKSILDPKRYPPPKSPGKSRAVQLATQGVFLDAYVETMHIGKAVKIANISYDTHYWWLEKKGPDGDAYRAAWAHAERMVVENLEAEARRRANGWEEDDKDGIPRYRCSDRLMEFILAAEKPDKFKSRSEVAVTTAQHVKVVEGIDSPRALPNANGHGNTTPDH